VQNRVQTNLAEQNRTLQRRADQMAGLQKENERLANLIAEAKSARSLPISQFNELLRLRGQVGRLNRDVQELAQLKTANSANGIDVLVATKKVWSERANQLKQWLEVNPAGKIPELQFLTDEDWIDCVYPSTLSSEEECEQRQGQCRTARSRHSTRRVTKVRPGP
jgi:hypothetical protein